MRTSPARHESRTATLSPQQCTEPGAMVDGTRSPLLSSINSAFCIGWQSCRITASDFMTIMFTEAGHASRTRNSRHAGPTVLRIRKFALLRGPAHSAWSLQCGSLGALAPDPSRPKIRHGGRDEFGIQGSHFQPELPDRRDQVGCYGGARPFDPALAGPERGYAVMAHDGTTRGGSREREISRKNDESRCA